MVLNDFLLFFPLLSIKIEFTLNQKKAEGSMVLFLRKYKLVENMLDEYFHRCDKCIDLFSDAMNIYFAEGLCDNFENAANNCHRAESYADDQRREIEHTLYGQALLPDSRGDLLGLLEMFDKIPNEAETVLFSLLCQRIEIGEDLKDFFKQLINLNVESYRLARKAVDTLFKSPKLTARATKEVDDKESESDRLERIIIGELFKGDYTTEQKILLRDIVMQVGGISDRAENSADRIDIVAIKRQI